MDNKLSSISVRMAFIFPRNNWPYRRMQELTALSAALEKARKVAERKNVSH